MITAILVDDDYYHLKALESMLIEHFKQVEVLASCSTVPEGVSKISELKPQLVFLDIEMSPYTGFDLLEMIEERDFEVIFTTSYQQYAIQAIKASALDYINKPVTVENLGEAIQRYKSRTGVERVRNLLANFKLADERQRIALYDTGGLSFFELENIIRCQSDNTYTEFYIEERDGKIHNIKKVEVSRGMSFFEDILVAKGFFFRVHNQHIVNINHIKRYFKEDGGYLIMDDSTDETVPVARARKDDFISFLKRKGILL